MAYIDQRIGRNQRAAMMIVAAAIQGGAIVALVNGLAVHFVKPPPPPTTTATDVPLPPLPTPTASPSQHHTEVQRHLDNPGHTTIVPTGPTIDTFPTTPTPLATPTPTLVALPTPTPVPGFTPRLVRPRNAPGSWATPGDYPARDLHEGNQGVTRFRLTVGADGRVQDCTVVASSGFPGLDKATCDNVSRRARFEPATDGEGNRTAGSYSGSIRWQIPQD
jgi:protein TonB